MIKLKELTECLKMIVYNWLDRVDANKQERKHRILVNLNKHM